MKLGPPVGGVDLDKDTRPQEKKGGREMATQLQPTPMLYGKDAQAVLDQIKKRPTKEQLRKAKERNEFFKQIEKKGL